MLFVADPCNLDLLKFFIHFENKGSIPRFFFVEVCFTDPASMLLLVEHDLLVLDELEFIELFYHVFLKLVPELLNLLLFVGVIPDIVLFLENPLYLSEFVPVLCYLGFQLLHLLNNFAVNLRC